MNERTCDEAGCSNKPRVKGLCNKHYLRQLYAGRQCTQQGCEEPVVSAQGLCRPHLSKRDRGTLGALTPSMSERFWCRVAVRPDGCWEWLGHVDKYGYGVASLSRGTHGRAHRVSWFLTHGTYPNGTIDHTCHTHESDCPSDRTCAHRRCVNPAHLADVSNYENIMRSNSIPAINSRKTHCKHGHPFDSLNTLISPQGHRVCRECKRVTRNRSAARARTTTP